MPAVRQIMLSEAIEQFSAYRLSECKPRTVEADRRVLLRFLRFVGDRQLRHLRREHAQNFFADVASEHRTADGRTRAPTTATWSTPGASGRTAPPANP